MSLTAVEMERLADDARAMATNHCRGYLKDALQCLRETRDPIASLELLRAMWGASQAKRNDQKSALDDAGQWLETRLVRDPGISPDRLALELGWLHRLVTVHGGAGDADDTGGDRRSQRRDEPSFGAHIDQLRRKRAHALLDADTPPAPRSGAARDTAPPGRPHPTHLPESVEVCFTDEQAALDAFRTARKRRKEQKPVKDRLLPVRPVTADLQPLAANLACSLLGTEGMHELQARALADAGKLPAFWIAVADLVDRDGKRVPRQISLAKMAGPPGGPQGKHR